MHLDPDTTLLLHRFATERVVTQGVRTLRVRQPGPLRRGSAAGLRRLADALAGPVRTPREGAAPYPYPRPRRSAGSHPRGRS